jgi:hypothetical protein
MEIRLRTYQQKVMSPWIQSIQRFLLEIEGKITIPQLRILRKLRKYDYALMDAACSRNFTKSQLEAINACRLFSRSPQCQKLQTIQVTAYYHEQ